MTRQQSWSVLLATLIRPCSGRCNALSLSAKWLDCGQAGRHIIGYLAVVCRWRPNARSSFIDRHTVSSWPVASQSALRVTADSSAVQSFKVTAPPSRVSAQQVSDTVTVVFYRKLVVEHNLMSVEVSSTQSTC